MTTIEIRVEGKVAQSPNDVIVCGNSDYQIHFSFSDEWNEHKVKTARFVYKNAYEDVVFEGDTVRVPVLKDVTMVSVGVYAGNLLTTTPALIGCKRSILCQYGTPNLPMPDVYLQLIQLFEAAGGGTFTPSVSDDGILSWTNDKGLKNPPPVNIKGENGKSAFELAIKNGFIGSEQYWLSSLQGKTGYSIYYSSAEILQIARTIPQDTVTVPEDRFVQVNDFIITANGWLCQITDIDTEKSKYKITALLMLRGLPGNKGDPFTYEDFTEEQLALLKGPKGDPYTLNEQDKQTIVDAVLDEVPTVETAEVGQTIVVKAIDENGKPTEWEAVDFPSGMPSPDGWELINTVTISAEDEVFKLLINTDAEGKPFSYDELYLHGSRVAATSGSEGRIFTNRDSYYQAWYVKLNQYFVTNAQGHASTFLKILNSFNPDGHQISQVINNRGGTSHVVGATCGFGSSGDKYTSFGLQTSSDTIFMSGTYSLYGRNYK